MTPPAPPTTSTHDAADVDLMAAAARMNLSNATPIGKGSGGEVEDSTNPRFVRQLSYEIDDISASSSMVGSAPVDTASGFMFGKGGSATVPLVHVKFPDAYCLGLVGQDGTKFCLAPGKDSNRLACSVQSHQSSKAKIEADHFYIATNQQCSSAYIEPRLPEDRLPRTITANKDLRTVNEWALILSRLVSFAPGVTPGSPSVLAKKPQMGPTPAFKSKPRAISFFDEPTLKPIKGEATNNDLRSGQETLASGVKAVKKRASDAMDEVDRLARHVDDVMGTQGTQITFINAQLGNMPVSDEVPSLQIWPSIAGLKTSHESLVRRVEFSAKLAGQASSDTAKQSRRVDQLSMQVDQSVRDLFKENNELRKILNMMLPIVHRVRALEEKAEASLTSAPGKTPLADSTGAGDIADLREELDRVKAGLGGEIVRILGRPYHSPGQLDPWVLEQAGEDGCPGYWWDVVSMLEAVSDAARVTDDTIDIQGRSSKAGHDSVLEARIVNSFSTTVPGIFTRRTKAEFSAIPKYEDWRSGDGLQGLVPAVERMLHVFDVQQTRSIFNRFAGGSSTEARYLAKKLLDDSIYFWHHLCNWVNDLYFRLTHRPDPPANATNAEIREARQAHDDVKKEAWKLITRILADMFQEFAQRRADGAAAQSEEHGPRKTGLILYSTLRAHIFMKELLAKEFERHPSMAPTFNAFLFSERASKSDVRRIDAKLSLLADGLRGLQGKVDKGGTPKKPEKKRQKKNDDIDGDAADE